MLKVNYGIILPKMALVWHCVAPLFLRDVVHAKNYDFVIIDLLIVIIERTTSVKLHKYNKNTCKKIICKL